MKLCKKCNNNWPEEFNVCPRCGVELISDQVKNSDAISMGDGNAINGGINVSKDFSSKDDHSVANSNNISNSNNKTTNISSHHIYHGNYTHVEREKTAEDILRENKLKYRECCKKVLSDGLITRDERLWLEEQRGLLGIPSQIADEILNEVRNNQKSFVPMSMSQRIQMENLKTAIESNMVRNIINILPKIYVIHNMVQDEELQYLYCMVLTALKPEECIKQYNDSIGIEDNYWLTFWTYIAYCKIGDVLNAEKVVLELNKWSNCKPSEDIELLEIIGYLIVGEKEIATEIFNRCISGEYSSELLHISNIVSSILFYNPEDEQKNEVLTHSKFYIEYFFNDFYQLEQEAFKKSKELKIAKQKADEEALRKAENTLREANEKMLELTKEREKFDAESKIRKSELENLENSLNAQKQKIESESRNIQAERIKLDDEIKRKKEDLANKEANLLEKQKKADGLHVSLVNKIENLEKEKNQVGQKSIELEKRREELTLLANELQKKENKLAEELKNITKEEEKRDVLNKNISVLETQWNILTSNCKELEKRIQEYTTKEKILSESCRELENKIQEQRAIFAKLEQKRRQYCPKCGSELSEGAVFCRKCGEKLL